MNFVYVEVKDKFPINYDIQKAIDGFGFMGYEIRSFTFEELFQIDNSVFINNIFVGSIKTMQFIFNKLKCYPGDIDFPESIIDSSLLNREIKITTLHKAIEEYRCKEKSVFIKPVRTKVFDGMPVFDKTHLCYFEEYGDINVYVCDLISIKSEWRYYIHNSELVHSSNYSGDFKLNIDYNYVEALIDAYTDPPIAYTIDIGLLSDDTHTVIEFNDFWAIGSYSIDAYEYSKMLEGRYQEIMKSYRIY